MAGSPGPHQSVLLMIAAPLLIVIAIHASETTQSLAPSQCLAPAEAQSIVAEHDLLPVSRAARAARGRVPGDLLRARLCETVEGHVYMFTLLGRDGRVRHVVVDAKSAAVLNAP